MQKLCMAGSYENFNGDVSIINQDDIPYSAKQSSMSTRNILELSIGLLIENL